MSFPCYPQLKDSEIDWLGAVPEHWKIKSVSMVFALGRGRVISNADIADNPGVYPIYSSQTEDNGEMGRIATYDFDGDYLTWTTDGANAGTVFLRSGKFNCTNVCGTLLAKEPLSLEFFNYAVGESTASYVRHDINPKLMNNVMAKIRLPVPHLEEQKSIANFLDHETAKIDALVEEQRRLMGLLKEKRQAVISHAVTKGLNPNAPMKDSGIEWLGEVPEHWNVFKLKQLTSKIGSGKTPRGGSEVYALSGVLFLRSQNIYDDGLHLNDVVYISDEINEEMSGTQVSAGDILLNITGASLGRTCVVPTPFPAANVNQHVCIIRIENKNIRELASWSMKSTFAETQIESNQNGAAREGLNFVEVGRIATLIPSPLEQIEIASFLKKQVAKIDQLVASSEGTIQLLQERRAALISAAVTGKIDVREPTLVIPFPISRARARRLIAMEIMERMGNLYSQGRTKLQKDAYLIETHADVHEIQGSYDRAAAGPFDSALVDEMENEATEFFGVCVEQPGGHGTPVSYSLPKQKGRHKAELSGFLGVERETKLHKLLKDLSELSLRSTEAVATLYAVWNDALIEGFSPNDDFIVDGFLNDWHPKKRERFKDTSELHRLLGWMHRHDLIPTGHGPKTRRTWLV